MYLRMYVRIPVHMCACVFLSSRVFYQITVRLACCRAAADASETEHDSEFDLQVGEGKKKKNTYVRPLLSAPVEKPKAAKGGQPAKRSTPAPKPVVDVDAWVGGSVMSGAVSSSSGPTAMSASFKVASSLDFLSGFKEEKHARLFLTLRHGECISAMAFSPDGKHLAIASENNTVRVYKEYATNRAPPLIELDTKLECVSALAFVSDNILALTLEESAKCQFFAFEFPKKVEPIDPSLGKKERLAVERQRAQVKTPLFEVQHHPTNNCMCEIFLSLTISMCHFPFFVCVCV
jgi:hypothetical protein